MKKLIFILLILVSFSSSVYADYISEIMFNPSEDGEHNYEYIEVYTNLNLDGFKVKDFKEEDILTLVKSYDSNYALIVGSNFDYSQIDANIYQISDSKIGNGLNNDEDLIIIYNDTVILDSVRYYDSWLGEEGFSICKIEENSFFETCNISPGQENNQIEITENYDLIIPEVLPDPSGDDDANKPNGEWIELYNDGSEDINIEEFYFKDEANHKLIISTLNSETIIKKGEYLVVYMNGFSGLLNNEGFEKISFYSKLNSLIDSFSYSNTRESVSISRYDDSYIFTKPSPGKKNYKESKDKSSDLEIERFYLGNDGIVRFGDLISLKINVYKGDSTKESISINLYKDKEKIRELSSFLIEEKFSENSLTLQIQLPLNCNNKLTPGEYSISLEGLDEETGEYLVIQENNDPYCNTKEETIKQNIVLESENNINNLDNQAIEDKIIYESKSAKSQRLALIIFSLVLCIVILYFNIKNDKS